MNEPVSTPPRRRYVPAVGPRLAKLLFVVFGLFALLAALAVRGAGGGALSRFAAEGVMWANGALVGLLPLAATVVWSIWLAGFASRRREGT